MYKHIIDAKNKRKGDYRVIFLYNDTYFGAPHLTIEAWRDSTPLFSPQSGYIRMKCESLSNCLNQIMIESQLVRTFITDDVSFCYCASQPLRWNEFCEMMYQWSFSESEKVKKKSGMIEDKLRKDFRRISNKLFNNYRILVKKIKEAGTSTSMRNLAGLNKSAKEEFVEIRNLTQRITNYTNELSELHKSIDHAFDSIPKDFRDGFAKDFLYKNRYIFFD